MTRMDRTFQRFYCLLGFLAATIMNAGLYSGFEARSWDELLARYFMSGLFIAGGVVVGVFVAATELVPRDQQ